MRDLKEEIMERLEDSVIGKFIGSFAIVMIAIIIVAVIFAILYGASWLMTCIVLKLIAICFGLSFNWLAATGIWLILCILKWFKYSRMQ